MTAVSIQNNRAARRRARRGLTLIEASAVLGIMAVVIAGALLLYQSASTNARVADAASELTQIQDTVRSVYTGQAGFTGLNNASVANSLPRKMNGTGGTLFHSFNGAITIAAATANGSDGFSIEFDGVPVDACLKLVAMDMGRGVTQLDVGGQANTTPPLNPSQATAQCGTSGAVNLIWYFAG